MMTYADFYRPIHGCLYIFGDAKAAGRYTARSMHNIIFSSSCSTRGYIALAFLFMVHCYSKMNELMNFQENATTIRHDMLGDF